MVQAIEDARAASDDRRWGDAWRLWSTLAAESLDVDDLDRAATAAYLTGHDEEGFARWVRAHQACLAAGAVHRAAYFGGKLAQGFGFKGDLGRCRGWVDRTARLLEEANIDCVEQGYLQWGLGMLRILEAGDVAGAHAHFVHAGKVGARFAHRELITVARIGEGRMLIYLGDIAEGLALLDEGMVAIEAGELSPLATGDAYCTVIDACSELSDLSRCRAWTESFVRWCDTQQELVLYRGHCFLHRAEILELLGAWPEALVEARHACDRLAAPVNPAALAAAYAIEGDLLRLVSDHDGAEAAYQRASEYGRDPQPGLALLRLAQGRLDTAEAMIRRALDEAQDPISRARLLAPYVDIVLCHRRHHHRRALPPRSSAKSRPHSAPRSCERTRPGPSVPCSQPRATPRQRSSSSRGVQRVPRPRRALPRGPRPTPHRRRLCSARRPGRSGHGVERGTLRARSAQTDLGSPQGNRQPGTTSSPGGLTQRELEILRLLARGKTNRGIAQELVISEKTVASHVSHIFTKLGVTSRSAATAYAYDHELVQ